MKSNLKNLIYGRSDWSRIVNIECKDSSAEIFQELEDGTIKSSFVDNSYWLLSNMPLDNGFNKLNGNLFFKYDKQYNNREDFIRDKIAFKQFSTFSIWEERESLMVIDGYTYYKGIKPEDVSVLAFDIETTGLDPKAKDAKTLLISNTYRKQGQIVRKLFSFDEYQTESDMLIDWCKWVCTMNPSLIIGHNIFGFDLNYLYTRAGILGTSLSLGRDDSILVKGKYEKQFRIDGSRDLGFYDFRIYGREIADTYFLVHRYDIGKNYTSYGLKPLIKELGLEDKNRVFYDASKIRNNYKNPIELEKIKQYAIMDGDDALKLYDKMIPAYFYSAQYIPKTFQNILLSASGSQINSIMLRSYLQEGHSVPKATEIANFQGGISFGLPGIYKNVWKIDIRSSYPTAILTKKLYDKQKDPFGNMLKLCEYFTNQRIEYKRQFKETKDEYYFALDQTSKIFINSIFGFCSAAGLNFNSPEIAAEITKLGRQFLNEGTEWATSKNIDYWSKIE
jgi:DNA polymerase, archaea type